MRAHGRTNHCRRTRRVARERPASRARAEGEGPLLPEPSTRDSFADRDSKTESRTVDESPRDDSDAWTQRSSFDGAFRPYTTRVRSHDGRAIGAHSVPSTRPITHTCRWTRKARSPPAADVTRRASPDARRADARRATHDAPTTARETRRRISFRLFVFARVDRGREAPSRGARRSVGRIGFRGAGGGSARSANRWTSRDRPPRGRERDALAGRTRGSKRRARDRGACGRPTRPSTSGCARRRPTDRRRSISCDES